MDKAEASVSHNEGNSSPTPVPYLLKTNKKGWVLVPQPTDDPHDPLNWSASKKGVTLMLVSLVSFSTSLQAVANNSGFFVQAEVYHKTAIQLSYSASSAIAGLAVGPFVWNPPAKRFGTSRCIAISLCLTICMNIWSALGSNIILETFFLHDRGKCFSVYTSMNLPGIIAASTLCGFIVQNASWTVQYWYNVGFEVFLAICCILLLDETAYPRGNNPEQPILPRNYVQRKIAIYGCTQRITPPQTGRELAFTSVLPVLIGISPVGVLIGLFLIAMFSWAMVTATDTSVYLQTPIGEGATELPRTKMLTKLFCSFIHIMDWVFASQIYCHFVNDQLALRMCAHHGGTWKPGYRLHALWFPSLFLYPVSLGLVGATLFYHLHFIVLAFAVFLTTIASISGVSVVLSYLVECFTDHPNEVAVVVNFYRFVFGIAVTFFILPWSGALGINWAYGMMAFFTAGSFIPITILMLWGPNIRARSLTAGKSDDGVKVSIEGHSGVIKAWR
ncbi:uncharacterized protein A1O5_06084 [Cladophialophora psammophila CBS 110553]|uniref:Major facilitator superfamily (MFS) profile domain-containing protein n=1 Tax=Cladophialophora psammophila CBS 110553 TaxID=1182543 RepID=W9X2C8_9EURO|nr:uncharacterized protein A1O5_06084 [Cladophialophora psammophila CBS 110553]EXJ71091.1 hypothetical protein A1O5_06084 [Cladophialophora psammophila CBS 110553]